MAQKILRGGAALAVAVAAVVGAVPFAAMADTPIIGGLQVANIQPGGAQITWVTNLSSDERVDYGTSTSFGSNSNSPCTGTDGSSSTNHCVNLTGLASSAQYYFQVTSCLSGACSTATGYFMSAPANSGTNTTTTQTADTVPPTAPSGISGYAVTSTPSIHVYWSASTDNVAVTGYHLYRNSTLITDTTSTFFIDPNVAPQGLYVYSVSAFDASGNVSPLAYSPSIVFPAAPVNTTTTTSTTDTTPPTPPSTVNVYIVTSTPMIYISWPASTDNVGVVGYQVYKNSALLVNVTSTTFVDHNVAPLATYAYSVAAVDAAGNVSSMTTAPSVTFPAPPQNTTTTTTTTTTSTTSSVPAAPSNLTISLSHSGTEADLSWHSNSSNQTRFEIYREKAGANWNYLNQVGASVTSYSDPNLTAGTYYYQVSACNGTAVNIGCSGGSNIVYAVVAAVTNTTTTTTTTSTSTISNTTTTITTTPTSTPSSSVQNFITGYVLFSNNQPVGNAEVGAYSTATGQWITTNTNGNGYFSLTVGAGSWQLGVRPKDVTSASWTAVTNAQASFANGVSGQTQTVNFTIPAPNATLVVRTVDDAGAVVPNAGVVVSTVSAAQATAVSSSPVYAKSDTNGMASFTLLGGTYYVRGYLPPTSGYFNPDEQSVTLSASATGTATLVFRKQTTSATTTLSGTTDLDDGTPAAAFVWAWSENGQTAQTNANTSGNFSLAVVPGRWHIGAGTEVGQVPYQSTGLTLDVSSTPVSVQIVLAKGAALPPPVTVSNQSTAQPITAAASDGAAISIPSGAVSSASPVTLNVAPTVKAPSQAAAKVVSTVYDVTLTTNAGAALTSFTKDITITIPYTDAALAAQGVTTGQLVPSYYDANTGAWVKVSDYVIDTVHHVVVLHVNHLTRFALIAAVDITPPAAPTNVTAKALGNGQIALSWINPTANFDHAKVYRSTVLGDLGKIEANSVSGASMTDANVTDGITYYYAVVAVSPDGNESTNDAQVSVVAVGTSGGSATFTRALRVGSRGSDVSALQQLLSKEGVYPAGIVSGYFGALTKAAVIRFQEKYATDILAPYGLTVGTGVVGLTTRAKLNALLQ